MLRVPVFVSPTARRYGLLALFLSLLVWLTSLARASGTHTHSWSVNPLLSGASPYVEDNEPYTGEVVNISAYGAWYPEADTCTTPDVYDGMEYIGCSFNNHE